MKPLNNAAAQTANKRQSPRITKAAGADYKSALRFAALLKTRVRHLLRAGETVLVLPEKEQITCPCCGHAMTFLHALRTRARPPPARPANPAASPPA